MRFKECLSYDDVLLVPQYSDIVSRREVNISTSLGKGFDFLIPIISSPMDTITESEMAYRMSSFGGLGIIHRYNSIDKQCELIYDALHIANGKPTAGIKVGAAIGVTGDYLERATLAVEQGGATLLCVDVAHGHHILMKKALRQLRLLFQDDVHIMAGNVATLEGYEDLCRWGASSVRCNIGSGAICSTKIQTGHGVSGLQTILDCAKSKYAGEIPIIADGGLRNSGDIVKALAAGADMVMLGSLLSGTKETPGQVLRDSQDRLSKVYRGMASKEAQNRWKGSHSSNEGIATTVPYKGKVSGVLSDLENGIRSGLSYSGARDILELQSKAKFIKQTTSGMAESRTHILDLKR